MQQHILLENILAKQPKLSSQANCYVNVCDSSKNVTLCLDTNHSDLVFKASLDNSFSSFNYVFIKLIANLGFAVDRNLFWQLFFGEWNLCLSIFNKYLLLKWWNLVKNKLLDTIEPKKTQRPLLLSLATITINSE